jgi:MYXO-CTERM domain-containing protein
MKKVKTALCAVMLCGAMMFATPVLAQNDNTATNQAVDRDDDDDDTGKWGLVGLLGLIGLAGLKRRDDDIRTRTTRNP